MSVPLYNDLDYDRFVNWQSRLAYELPFIEEQLAAVGAKRLLDAACGTGMHAIALAQRGYRVVGADLSPAMVERARMNASADHSAARFVVAGLGQLAERVAGQFDVLLCLGNSLPHVLTPAALHVALRDFAAVLRTGGLLLLQNRNFDQVLASRNRWMEPQSHQENESEWLYMRFYDFEPDGALAFNVLTLQREDGGAWQQRAMSTTLWPQTQSELMAALELTGWGEVKCYGDMKGAPFKAESSGNLTIVACK